MKSFTMLVLFCVLPLNAAHADMRVALSPDGAEYLSDRIIVTLRPGMPQLTTGPLAANSSKTGSDAIDRLCAEYDITGIEPWFPHAVRNPAIRNLVARMYVFIAAPGGDIRRLREAFRIEPGIERADIYEIPRPFYTPNDPQRFDQWHLTKMRVYEAWDRIHGDTTAYAIVGIIDSGVYWMHPDLAPNMWINSAEDINGNGTMDAPDINGIDEDGNGYIDDVIGWDCGENDNDPRENSPLHGTHVAGCASEATDNNRNGAGLGFSARIMAVKGTNAADQLTAVYQGLVWAADNGAQILNCSWGSPSYSATNQTLMNTLWGEGIIIVAAAGNNDDNVRSYPAAYNNVLAVAATNSSDVKAPTSSYGTWVDVCAPGVNIYSTWDLNSMAYGTGTSISSPITAGLAALLRVAHPDWSNQAIVDTIIATTDDVDALNPDYAGQLGSGRINALRALPSCSYLPGDINANEAANGIDVVYGVAYLKGGTPPPLDCGHICVGVPNPFFAAMDVNGNCAANGIDITFFVAYLKGIQPALLFCEDCVSQGGR